MDDHERRQRRKHHRVAAQGHAPVTLSVQYVRDHVSLGYAGTAHGHQGETVDVGLAVITARGTTRLPRGERSGDAVPVSGRVSIVNSA